MKQIETVAAVIIKDGRCLCTKRNISNYKYISYKYEFPACELALGETKEETLTREMFEELSVEIKVHDLCKSVKHTYADFHVNIDAYFCQILTKEIHLHEHIEYIWLLPSELDQLDWAEANMPIVELLMAL